MRAIIEVLDKETGEKSFEELAEKWMNPKLSFTEYTDEDTQLRPKTFDQAFTMLIDMLNGEIFQNLKYAVRLKGVKHKTDWLKKYEL